MEKTKYDIFISYRRIGGKNYARTLKPELEKRGFRVFLDFDELKDGVFDKRIMDAINEAPIFLVILSKGALDRCANDGDWVREEILYADKTNRHIVPVEVDKTFREFPDDLPVEVKSVLGPHQFSQIDTETLLQESIDKMVRERIKPYVLKDTETSLSEEEITEGAEIHIEVDADCELYRFKRLVKKLYAGEDNVVHLMPGKHKVDFVSVEFSDIKDSQIISIPSLNYSDFMEISLSEQIDIRRKEEIKKQEEQKRIEEEARKRREEEERLKEEARRLEEKKEREHRKKLQGVLTLVENVRKFTEKYNAMSADKLAEEAEKCDHDLKYKKALKLYLAAAQKGRDKDYYRIACFYFNGYGTEQNEEIAFLWCKKAAERDDVKAQKSLGDMYYYGTGVEINYHEAAFWYEKASNSGDFVASYNLGYMYYEGIGVLKNIDSARYYLSESVKHDYSKAKKKLKELEKESVCKAEARVNEAFRLYKKGLRERSLESFLQVVSDYDYFPSKGKVYNQIGEILYEQHDEAGYEEDYEECINWYRKSAELGYAKGQYNLAIYYLYGKGVKQDYKEAIKLLRKAAGQNNALALELLGDCYYEGRGVVKDNEHAKSWYIKASKQGSDSAEKSLNKIFLEEKIEKLGKDELKSKGDDYYYSSKYSEAYPYYLKASKLGDASCQCNLGLMYETGRGVCQDYSEAVKWYRESAGQGNQYAQTNLGYMYKRGQGVGVDYSEAMKWFMKAADQGNLIAINGIGVLYEEGLGVSKYYSEAVKWYRKAAEKGYSYSQNNLGRMYEEGNGVTKDFYLAISWYEKAANQGLECAKENLKRLLEEKPKLHVVKDGNRFGYANTNGDIIIPCKYSKAEEFVCGVGLVWNNKKMGAINEIGSHFFDCKISCEEATYLGHHLIRARRYSGGLFSIYNLEGKNVDSELYSKIGDKFEDGYIEAVQYRMFGKDKPGRIDTDGKFFVD